MKVHRIYKIIWPVVSLSMASAIHARPAGKNSKKTEKAVTAPAAAKPQDEIEPTQVPVSRPAWHRRFVPVMGGLVPLGIPVTGIQNYIGLGYGFEVFGSVDFGHLLLKPGNPFALRAVLSVSGYFYSNKAGATSASLMLFPIIFSVEASYALSKQMKLLTRIGAGGTFDTVKINDATVAKTSDASLGFTYQADLGAAYRLPQASHLEILLLGGYMGDVQTLSASFLNIRAGVAWIF